jgi:flavin prenyltransferase
VSRAPATPRAARYGAIVMPPVPAFYHRPKTLDDVINQTVGKALDLFNVSHTLFKRWKEKEGGGFGPKP